MVTILFFGSTASVTGKREITLDPPRSSKAKKVFDDVIAEYPQLASYRLLFSINQQYATGDEIVRDGDEFAIFTAVSGG